MDMTGDAQQNASPHAAPVQQGTSGSREIFNSVKVIRGKFEL
jgi:hypothetical protein